MTTTHTRTHVFVTLANPFMACDTCHQPVTSWHDSIRCGCGIGGNYNRPCEHPAAVHSRCPSWSPVDGCCCLEVLGRVDHPSAPTGESQ